MRSRAYFPITRQSPANDVSSVAPAFYPERSRRTSRLLSLSRMPSASMLASLPAGHATAIRLLFSPTYKTLFPQVLSFDIHTKRPGYTPSTFQSTAIFAPLTSSTSFVSHSCALFCTSEDSISPIFSYLRTLSKTPGVGGVTIRRKIIILLALSEAEGIEGEGRRAEASAAYWPQPSRSVEMNAVSCQKWYSSESARPARSTPLWASGAQGCGLYLQPAGNILQSEGVLP